MALPVDLPELWIFLKMHILYGFVRLCLSAIFVLMVPDPEMLMFSDEVHKDERTSNRQMRWSYRGARCVQRKCFIRGKRFSILPIITLDGIIAHDIIEGSVTSE